VTIFGTALMDLGGQLVTDSSKERLGSSFLAGILAVIVTTLCTVPFRPLRWGLPLCNLY